MTGCATWRLTRVLSGGLPPCFVEGLWLCGQRRSLEFLYIPLSFVGGEGVRQPTDADAFINV
jgi:hypothetical protein